MAQVSGSGISRQPTGQAGRRQGSEQVFFPFPFFGETITWVGEPAFAERLWRLRRVRGALCRNSVRSPGAPSPLRAGWQPGGRRARPGRGSPPAGRPRPRGSARATRAMCRGVGVSSQPPGSGDARGLRPSATPGGGPHVLPSSEEAGPPPPASPLSARAPPESSPGVRSLVGGPPFERKAWLAVCVQDVGEAGSAPCRDVYGAERAWSPATRVGEGSLCCSPAVNSVDQGSGIHL